MTITTEAAITARSVTSGVLDLMRAILAKDSMIGGIYSRPLSLGNCVHFVVGSLALAKQQLYHDMRVPLIALLIVYTVFATSFAWLVFGYGAACKVAAPERQNSRY